MLSAGPKQRKDSHSMSNSFNISVYLKTFLKKKNYTNKPTYKLSPG